MLSRRLLLLCTRNVYSVWHDRVFGGPCFCCEVVHDCVCRWAEAIGCQKQNPPLPGAPPTPHLTDQRLFLIWKESEWVPEFSGSLFVSQLLLHHQSAYSDQKTDWKEEVEKQITTRSAIKTPLPVWKLQYFILGINWTLTLSGFLSETKGLRSAD